MSASSLYAVWAVSQPLTRLPGSGAAQTPGYRVVAYQRSATPPTLTDLLGRPRDVVVLPVGQTP